MSNDTQLIANFQARVTVLYQAYGDIDDLEGTIQAEVRETVEAILWAIDRHGKAYDPRNEATRDLAYTRRKIENLLASVRVMYQDALVESKEEWGGIENAPRDYCIALGDLRELRADIATLKADIDRACAPLLTETTK